MSEYHHTVAKIRSLLDSHAVQYQCFEHEAVRTSEEAAAIRPEYSIHQGETVWGTVARGCQVFLEFTNRNSDNLNRFCKKLRLDYDQLPRNSF